MHDFLCLPWSFIHLHIFFLFLFVVSKHGEYHFAVWMECVAFLYGHFTFHLLLLQVSATKMCFGEREMYKV